MWHGIQMISQTYRRMITRYGGEVPVELALQYRTAKVQAMALLSDRRKRSLGGEPGGRTGPVFDLAAGEDKPTGGSRNVKLPPAERRQGPDLQDIRRRSSVGRALHS